MNILIKILEITKFSAVKQILLLIRGAQFLQNKR